MHMEKRDAHKCLRAALQTLRNQLPVELAVHFGAQLPMLIWVFITMDESPQTFQFGQGEMVKVTHTFRRDMQSLFPALASVA